MRFCPKCGAELKAGAKFCPHCGYQLTEKKTGEAASSATPKSAKPSDAEEAKGTAQKAMANGQQKPHKSTKRSKYGKWLVGVIVVIILVVVGYRQVYLPQMVKSTVASNGFTSAKGYTVATNLSKHAIVVTADQDQLQNYSRSLAANHFDTRRLGVENQLSGLAHDVNSRALGTWRLAIAAKTNRGSGLMWEYDGTKESHRYQTTSECRQLHERYLEEKQAEQQQAQEADRDEKIGAGLLGGGIGLLLGGL